MPADRWPNVRLGDLVKRVRVPIVTERDRTYVEIGIRSHGKGLFHKEPITGRRLGNKSVFAVQAGCLVFNIVFAWEQAVAITSDAERGLIASHRFPMYRPIDSNLSLG